MNIHCFCGSVVGKKIGQKANFVELVDEIGPLGEILEGHFAVSSGFRIDIPVCTGAGARIKRTVRTRQEK